MISIKSFIAAIYITGMGYFFASNIHWMVEETMHTKLTSSQQVAQVGFSFIISAIWPINIILDQID